MIGDTSRDRWRRLKRTVDLAEIIDTEIEMAGIALGPLQWLYAAY